jgi:enoyl-CoA hydratase/carnithine racemase
MTEPAARPDEQATDVAFSIIDGVGIIELNRPDKLNAVTPEMAARIGTTLRAADADPSVRAIVLTGRGRGFCSGADLAVLAGGPAALASFVADPASFPDYARTLSKPVVAAANGPVAGVGVAYLTAADIRFAGESARFTTSFARLGLVAEYGLSWLLPRLVGRPAATDLLLSGRTIDAAEALRIGLVSAIAPDEELFEHAVNYARDLAANCSPRSLAVIKRQLWTDTDGGYAQAFQRSLDLMVASFEAPDLAEAIEAGQQRRGPQFPSPAPH